MASPVQTVWSRELDEHDARDHDAFVASAKGGHYSQTAAWAKVAIAGRRREAQLFLARRDSRVIGAAVVLRPRAAGPLLTPVAILERGPVVDDLDDLEPVLGALVSAALRHGVARITSMPYWSGEDASRAEAALARAGFKDVQELDGAHTTTMRVDVDGKSDEQLLAGSEKKKLRYELRQSDAAGAVVRRGTRADVALLARLDAELAEAQGKKPRAAAWYDALDAYLAKDETRGAIFVCEHQGEVLSALLALRHARMAVYSAGASISAPREFSKMARPLFEAVKWARDQGCTTFDLGGVPMEGDDDPKRAAIARFKRDFSKTPVRLVREHARWF